MNPFQVVKDFERALCDYTGAPYAVTTTSCTMALLLAVAWHVQRASIKQFGQPYPPMAPEIEIPKRTYVGVPMSIVHAGGRPTFRDEEWSGAYQLKPLPVWDCARRFTSNMYLGDLHAHGLIASGHMLCVSFHWSKILGIQQGGAILHDDPEADAWLRRARFDGRTEGVPATDDVPTSLGWHAYLAPETAAAGLVRLHNLPRHNADLPGDDYPDLSTFEIFK